MTKLRYLLVSLALTCSWACGGPEHTTVDQFFRSAQSDDRPTLASMSAVGPPGKIAAWKVVEVSSRTTEPYELPELVERFETATSEREAVLEEGRKYLEDEVDALDQILPKLQEDPDYKFSGKIGEIQEEWTALVERRKEKERVFQELKRTVFQAKNLAAKSVMRQIPVEELSGDVAVTELLVHLTPEGGEDELPFAITLRKYDLMEAESDRVEPARWIITSIEGTSDEARAVADAARAGGPKSAASAGAAETASSQSGDSAAAEGAKTVRSSMTYQPRELRGVARVQILEPETKIDGNDVVSTVRVRNSSKDWITRFTATEYWYDDAGTATRGGSRTHDRRFMPGEIIEMQLRTTKNEKFYQNQFEFSYEHGEVNATVVAQFPQN